MSNRIVTYETKSSLHPDRYCDMAVDRFLDVNGMDHQGGVKFRSDVSAFLCSDSIIFNGIMETPGSSIKEPAFKEVNFFENNISHVKLTDLSILEEAHTKNGYEFYNDLKERGGHVMGYAVNNEHSKLPVYVHIAERICTTLETKFFKDGNRPIVVVKCMYDIDQDEATHIIIKIGNTETVSGQMTDMFKNNDFGFSDNVLSKIKVAELTAGTDLTTNTYLHTRFYQNPERVVSDLGMSKSKFPYGPYFKPISPAGKDMGSPERGGSYLARYIAKNIVGTGKFDDIEVHLTYPYTYEDKEPHIHIKARMYGSAEVEFEFPEHFHEDIKNIFPVKLSEVKEKFARDENNTFENLSEYGEFGNNEFPWEKMDKVEKVDDIRI